jgi:uncharacterized protein (TIGR02996 family)
MSSDIFELMQNHTFRGLLADIHAEPASDDLRLILADWLEDRSDEWGTFIRYQTTSQEKEAEARKDYKTISYWGRFCRRLEQDLNSWSGATDLAWRRISYADSIYPLRYCRGFLQGITVNIWDWYRYGKQICELHPVAEVRAWDIRPLMQGTDYGVSRFWWCPETSYYTNSAVPEAIYKCLFYPGAATEEDAMANLEKACLLFARTGTN